MTTTVTRPVAVVSGGSRGIGAAVVERLASDGYDIALCFRSRPDAAEHVTEVAGRHGAAVLAKQVDVADGDAVRAFVAAVEDELGAVDTVVTSAGITRDASLAVMDDAAWHDVIDTNLTGVYNLCRAAVYPMLKRGRGSIVNISSVAGVYGNVGQTNYAASKAGIIGFTKSLAKEVGRYGVRANVVAPGFIETDMTQSLTDSQRTKMTKQIPTGRWGSAAEVAAAVAFLASTQATYVTGSVLHVDGGIAL